VRVTAGRGKLLEREAGVPALAFKIQRLRGNRANMSFG
jgi:hypothetical protein